VRLTLSLGVVTLLQLKESLYPRSGIAMALAGFDRGDSVTRCR